MATPVDPLHERLAAPDDPPLPAGLWPRVAHARRRQLRIRRTVLGGGAVTLCALLLLPLHLAGPGSRPGDGAPSRTAAAGTVPVRAPATTDPAARLRILDRELQDAYRRGSDDAEIAQLWAARAALLREGAATLPVRPVRI